MCNYCCYYYRWHVNSKLSSNSPASSFYSTQAQVRSEVGGKIPSFVLSPICPTGHGQTETAADPRVWWDELSQIQVDHFLASSDHFWPLLGSTGHCWAQVIMETLMAQPSHRNTTTNYAGYFRSKIMEGGPAQPAVSKPTGANKRKGANPVKQIISSDSSSETCGHSGSPLDLSLRQEEARGQRARKVILSVPQYKSVTPTSASSPTSSSSSLSDSSTTTSTTSTTSSTSSNSQPELSVTPVIKKEILNDQDDFESDLISNNNFALHSFLNNQTQALFSLEHLKQASLIFQKHARNAPSAAVGFKNEFLQPQPHQSPGETKQPTVNNNNNNNIVWNNLVTSTVTSSEGGCDDKRKIHKCDFPTCDKVYTKSSHLKAHKRNLCSDLSLFPVSVRPIPSNKFVDKKEIRLEIFILFFTFKLLLFCTSSNLLLVDIFLL